MKLNVKLFQRIIDDLEEREAKITVMVEIIKEKLDYTILAEFPSGEKWEIVDIKKLK